MQIFQSELIDKLCEIRMLSFYLIIAVHDFMYVLLVSDESRVKCVEPKHPKLTKNEVEIIFGYIQTWQQR